MCLSSPNRALRRLWSISSKLNPGVRSYSLPSVGWTHSDGTQVKPHIEFGIKAEGEAVNLLDAAWAEVLHSLDGLGAELKNRVN